MKEYYITLTWQISIEGLAYYALLKEVHLSYKNNSTDSIKSTSTNNVAFVINSLEGGGAERVMANALRIMQSYY